MIAGVRASRTYHADEYEREEEDQQICHENRPTRNLVLAARARMISQPHPSPSPSAKSAHIFFVFEGLVGLLSPFSLLLSCGLPSCSPPCSPPFWRCASCSRRVCCAPCAWTMPTRVHLAAAEPLLWEGRWRCGPGAVCAPALSPHAAFAGSRAQRSWRRGGVWRRHCGPPAWMVATNLELLRRLRPMQRVFPGRSGGGSTESRGTTAGTGSGERQDRFGGRMR